MLKQVAQKLFGNTISVFGSRLVCLCTLGNLVGRRDAYAILMTLGETCTYVILQVCTVRPDAGWFLVQEAKPTVVKTVRC